MAYGYVPFNVAYKRVLPVLPGFDSIAQNYQRYRIPRPPEFDPAATEPGKICWGSVGAMPSPEQLGSVGFNVNKEVSRKTEDVRIENPDDPSQYVIADRATEITFDRPANTPPGPNTSSQTPSGMIDYTALELLGFVPHIQRSAGSTTFIYADSTGG